MSRSPTSSCSARSARSAAVVNEEIRGLLQRSDGLVLSTDDEATYQGLLVEWAAATRTTTRPTRG
ncbi:hypothetical protein OG233_28940 [Streptomyces sp. NBC_01218]|uniref:hypothetical protein n=1 Tax=unclassified Streptomyces TaxID=2593676 RepID=UPI0023B8E1AB|nr:MULTISPECIES: hypothetical protein [unclassified Streptomyces]WEH43215.1 hypothetical protein PZB77_29005 [Streptomyces sp. AM 2-1-1]WSQ54854.1 hypothetical protein OG233_28940 [Streptomyces sp. NBC_01218]